ncbi:hypothetical protein, partial [Mesorhizobium sp.]|uniref:hypothetical protein n=1 Tax=Mesorhizobium sp. TaxID=1871066 RepID=UPI0025C2DB37
LPNAWSRCATSAPAATPETHALAAKVLCPGGQSGSTVDTTAEPLWSFVFSQFRTENRGTLFLELLGCSAARPAGGCLGAGA